MTDPKELSNLDPLLTRNDLEAILQVGERTIRRWVFTGQFPRPIKLGGTQRWRKEEVRAFLERLPAKEITSADGSVEEAPVTLREEKPISMPASTCVDSEVK